MEVGEGIGERWGGEGRWRKEGKECWTEAQDRIGKMQGNGYSEETLKQIDGRKKEER